MTCPKGEGGPKGGRTGGNNALHPVPQPPCPPVSANPCSLPLRPSGRLACVLPFRGVGDERAGLASLRCGAARPRAGVGGGASGQADLPSGSGMALGPQGQPFGRHFRRAGGDVVRPRGRPGRLVLRPRRPRPRHGQRGRDRLDRGPDRHGRPSPPGAPASGTPGNAGERSGRAGIGAGHRKFRDARRSRWRRCANPGGRGRRARSPDLDWRASRPGALSLSGRQAGSAARPAHGREAPTRRAAAGHRRPDPQSRDNRARRGKALPGRWGQEGPLRVGGLRPRAARGARRPRPDLRGLGDRREPAHRHGPYRDRGDGRGQPDAGGRGAAGEVLRRRPRPRRRQRREARPRRQSRRRRGPQGGACHRRSPRRAGEPRRRQRPLLRRGAP